MALGPLSPSQVWRRYNVDGVPASGNYKVNKDEVAQLFDMFFSMSIAPGAVKQTKAALDLVTPDSEDYGGVVLNDPNPANNGYYYRDSAVWVRGRGFPDTFAKVMLSGDGTAQTGTVDAGVNPADIEVFFAEVTTTNSGALTLSMGGSAVKPVLDVNGNTLAPGLWTAGRIVMFRDHGDAFRLLSDPDADGAAMSAAASSQEARDALEDLLQKYLGSYADNTAAAAAAAGVGGAVAGMIYWNTTSSVFRYWDGDSWEAIPYATVADGAVTAQKLDSALAAQVVPRTSSLTINVPTDYASVQLAMEAANLYRFKAGRIPVINIESGHLLSAPIEFDGVDFHGMTIQSVDAIVQLDDSFPKIFPAARWDGAGTRSRRTAALSGVTDGKKGIVSFWAKFNGGDAATQPLIVGRSGADIAFTVRRASTGVWQIQGRSTPAGTLVLSMSSNSVWNVADGWHHVLASWDLAAGQAQLYINDLDDRAAAPTVTNTAIDYTLADWGFGCEPASAADPSLTMNGDLAEVYINLAESLDLSVTANRRKFIQASGAPEVLGWRATRPTSNRPALWFNGVYQSFRENFGTGGKFTNSGTFVPAPTYPDGTAAGEAAGDGAHICSLRNCTGLIWNILVDGDGHAFQGFDIYRTDIQIGGTGKGIKNCLEDNIEANKGSRVTARDAIFSGAGYRGIQADGGSYVDAVGVSVNESFWGLNAQNGSLIDGSPEGGADSPLTAVGCYDRAVIADEQARVNLWTADLSECAGSFAVEVMSGASIYMQSATTDAGAPGVPDLSDCRIDGATATGWGYQTGASGTLFNV